MYIYITIICVKILDPQQTLDFILFQNSFKVFMKMDRSEGFSITKIWLFRKCWFTIYL